MTLRAIDPLRERLPLHGTAASRAIERTAQATLPAHTLMQRAGLAVARLALAIAPHAARVWIAAGPGNNGGDGLEAAPHLLRAGKSVSITLYGDAARLPADAALSLQRARAAGVPIDADAPATAGAHGVAMNGNPLHANDLAIDALLGLGARSSAGTPLGAAIESLRGLACPVLSIDLPSGLDATTGQALGGPVVSAAHTVSLLTLKPGLYTGAGRDHAGRIWHDDLDVDTGGAPPDAWLSGGPSMLTPLAPRRHVQHKGSFGDVQVVGGARGMVGGALLAARAALAAGAGRVYLDLLDGESACDPVRPELMFRGGAAGLAPQQLNAATVLAGCGGGDAMRDPLPSLLAHSGRLVLDADALNAIAADAALQQQLQARAARGRITVLTPHPLEAARLLATTAAAVQSDRLAASRQLADRYRCCVVLKGSGSVTCAPAETAWINPTGDARLATPGSGDVLAGWLAGWWAQWPAATLEGALQVAAAAVFRHGLAAARATTSPVLAAELIDAMRSTG